MKKGIYVLRNERTAEWPYSVAVAVDGPFDDLKKAEAAFLEYSAIAGAGECKLRRWDGNCWRAAVD